MAQRDPAFGHIVKERRRALDLTQTELARRVACATVTIRRIEYDTLRPSQQIAERLAMALNVPLPERARFVQWARTAGLAEQSPPPLPTPTPAPEEIGRPDLSGRAIRGYELGERLGTGGFGVVYRAVQPLLEREVAVKIILPQYADHPDFIRRFEAEAQLVARLEHPYIVPLYDYWREPGVAYLVMRLLRGGSLEDRVRAGPLALEAVAVLLEQIGAALHAAHRAGVVHRDLKPANVLLDEDGNGYLADFGIAKNLNVAEQTQVGTIVASPAYASPEQIRSETVLPQADIYGLGVLLYELLVGEKPFPGPTPIDYIQQHLTSPLPPLAACLALDPLVRRATAKDPLARYPDVPSLLADLRQALAGRRLPAVPYALAGPGAELENPYKGLRAFGEADAADFFGRDTLVQELLGSMATTDDLETLGGPRELGRFLAVVGPSGCGKSSVVQAGLLPALRRGGLPGSEQWFIVDMQPGAHPWEALEAALLRIAVNPPESLLAQLQDGERGLLRAVRRVLPADPGVELVLVIDQFEELFTQVADEEERAAFIAALVTAVVDPESRVRLVVTLRADFTDRPLQYVDLGELVRQRAVFVLPLTADELEQAIGGPAARAGLGLEEGLAAALIRDVGAEPGLLPLLQYALTELCERRVGRTLTLAVYHESGGVSGALARRAEELYAGLGGGEREAARQLFLRLVTLGEGSEDTRRRVLQSEVEALGEETGGRDKEAGNRMQEVIRVFGRHRLLTFDRDPLTRGPTVEVAHEALLREWGRLRAWLEESRGDVRLQRLLAAAAGEWESAGREPSYLLQGARLAQFAGWAAESRVALTDGEREYLAASVAAQGEREEEEKARREHELQTALQLAETEKARAEEQGRHARRLRQRALWLAGALAVVAALALAAVWFGRQATLSADSAQAEARSRATQQAIAEYQQGVAETQQAVAEDEAQARATQQAIAQGEAYARATAEAVAVEERQSALDSLNHSEALRLASEANRLLLKEGNPELIALLALRSLRFEYTPQGDEALGAAAQLDYPQRILTGHGGDQLDSVAWSPNGRYIAASGTAGVIYLWDAASAQEAPQFISNTVSGWNPVFSPDSRYVLGSYTGGIGRMWDVATGQEVRQFTGLYKRFSPDGRFLVTAELREEGFRIHIWDVATGAEVRAYPLPATTRELKNVLWSPDGRSMAALTADKTILLWDATSGELTQSFSVATHTGTMWSMRWSSNGQTLVTADYEGTALRWDVATGQELQRFEPGSRIYGLALSPDGRFLLLCTEEGISHLYDATTGVALRRFRDPAQVFLAAFAPDGRTVAIASTDGHVRLWAVVPQGGLPRLPTVDTCWMDVAFSPDGRTLATAGTDGTARLWDAQSGAELRRFTGHTAEVGNVAFAPDGRTLVTTSSDRTARLWDVQTGAEVRSFTHTYSVNDVAFSPDGQSLVTFVGDATAVGSVATAWLWDVASGEPLRVITLTTGYQSLAYSPLGDTILTGGSDGTASLWNVQTGVLAHVFTVTQEPGPVYEVTYSPDGRSVALAGQDGGLHLLDLQTGVEMRRFLGTLVGRGGFSPDGRYLFFGFKEGTAVLWDTATGQELRRFAGHTGIVWGAAVSPDGRIVATASADGTARLWYADINDTIADLCGRLLRDMTAEEREHYGIVDEGPTCPLRVER